MADKRDYYDVLGVSKSATEDEIRKAYRSLAKKYHPDVSKEAGAEAKFKEVQEAYDVLSDATKKQNYDQFGHAGAQGGAGFEGFSGFNGFGDFGDIFSSIFGGGQSRGRREDTGVGADIEIRMTIDFMEAVLGTTKKVTIDQEIDCMACNGTGAHSPKDIETCDRCHGSGYINVEQRTVFGAMRSQQVCSKCGGTGKHIKNKCKVCNGAGRTKQRKEVDVNIPAGVDNNNTLRVPGMGNGGKRGAANGDLYITFRVKNHAVFQRNGSDIVLNIPLSFSQAALGTEIDVPTIYGDVKLKVPAGIQSGTSLRLKDKGVANPRGGKKGDQHVIVDIKTPTNLSSEEKKIFEQLDTIESPKTKTAWDKFKNFFKS